MQYLVTAKEMKTCDRNTSEHFGVPSIVLMERAALAVAARIGEWKRAMHTSRAFNVLIVAGHGGNGGDGIAIGRILYQHGYRVQIALVDDKDSNPDTASQKKCAEAYNIPMDTFSNVRATKSQMEWDIIVDAVLGIGCTKDVEGEYVEAIMYINECKKLKDESTLVVAVDIPSGIDTDTGSVHLLAVKADLTVTFNFAKMGQLLYPGTEYCGQLFVEDVGITVDGFLGNLPEYFFFDEGPEDLLPRRVGYGNKGTFGKVLVIAGSDKVTGACLLCSKSAFHTGAGMVKVFTTPANVEAIKSSIPEAMFDSYANIETDSNIDKIRDILIENMKWASAIVIGPGIGTGMVAKAILSIVLEHYDKFLVADADAITLIAQDRHISELARAYSDSKDKQLVITPHVAEFARLYNAAFGDERPEPVTVYDVKENMLKWPLALSEYYNCVVICKDARSVVAGAGKRQMYVNISGNSGMATAGSGDVLAGIIGALSSRKLGAFQTACIGTFIHGLAGNRAASRVGEYYMTASDIIKELANVLPEK
ncbi:NAD(P)H-hydrate dehydratase [Butyrivibrio fibrisolvens]|uniref:NAD(P)H-hydrate dehydratase n=1 Tax=Butyrivibrio fibrisolvens TaxID=831 RepID=UPI00200B057B|nr:NAD(P)H-hydrate dehydratase [Butyrivibrio fibrisolvens]